MPGTVLRDIRREIVRLLEGRAGISDPPQPCDRYIPRGKFRHTTEDIDETGSQGGATPRYNFSVLFDGYRGATDTPTDATGGNYLFGRYGGTISIGYGRRPLQEDVLNDEISNDFLRIADVLMTERNWSPIEGWTGCRILSSDLREGGKGDPAPMIVNEINFEIVYRQQRGPYE